MSDHEKGQTMSCSHSYAVWLAAHQCGHDLTAWADSILEGPDSAIECGAIESFVEHDKCYGCGYGGLWGEGCGYGDGEATGDGRSGSAYWSDADHNG